MGLLDDEQNRLLFGDRGDEIGDREAYGREDVARDGVVFWVGASGDLAWVFAGEAAAS